MTSNDPAFSLHPRLAADTLVLGSLTLSRILLMNDARYPWLILVPAVADARELHDLEAGDRILLMEEIAGASRRLSDQYAPDKINVGAIGNIVPQLHVHVVARREGDPAWPAPVWGVGTAKPYGETAAAEVLAALRGGWPGLVAAG